MAKKTKHGHLVKPLLIQDPPAGLYKEPCFWMQGKDMEGFNAQFSYGFIKETGPFHPIEGALIHPYDECLVFAGIDNTNIEYLGAEITVEIGEEREVHNFNKPSVVIVPKGTPHGSVTVNSLKKPIVHYSLALAPDYKAKTIAPGSLPAKTTGTKHARFVKPLGPGFQPIQMSRDYREGKLKPDELNMRGADQVGLIGPGNADYLTWLYGNQLEGLNLNFTWGFYTQSGIWHRGGEAHTHPEEEILVFAGLDPDNLEFLGCEQELCMGDELERHVFKVPTVAVCPQGFAHLPLITRWTDKPYSFVVACLSGEHDAPWVDEE